MAADETKRAVQQLTDPTALPVLVFPAWPQLAGLPPGTGLVRYSRAAHPVVDRPQLSRAEAERN